MSAVKKFKPLFDRILVQKITSTSTKSVGGIVLPDSAKPKYNQFKVVATGQGLRKRDGEFAPLSVKTGDTVIVGDAYGAQELTFDNETYHLYREDDVLGILD